MDEHRPLTEVISDPEVARPTRRTWLEGALAAAAAVALGGCAALPDLVRRGAGTHPCDARFCRYWAPPRPGHAGRGTCVLPVRARGGA